MPLVTLLDSPASWRAVVPGESQIYDDHLNVLLKQKLNKQKKEKDTKWETDIAVFRVDAGSRTGESVRSGSSSGLVVLVFTKIFNQLATRSRPRIKRMVVVM